MAADEDSLPQLRTFLRIIAGRESAGWYCEIETDPGVDWSKSGGAEFAVCSLFEARRAIAEARTLVQRSRFDAALADRLCAHLRLAEACLADSDTISAQHFRVGNFSSAVAVAKDAADRMDRDATTGLLLLAEELIAPPAVGTNSRSGPRLRFSPGHRVTKHELDQLEKDARRLFSRKPKMTALDAARALGLDKNESRVKRLKAWRSRNKLKTDPQTDIDDRDAPLARGITIETGLMNYDAKIKRKKGGDEGDEGKEHEEVFAGLGKKPDADEWLDNGDETITRKGDGGSWEDSYHSQSWRHDREQVDDRLDANDAEFDTTDYAVPIETDDAAAAEHDAALKERIERIRRRRLANLTVYQDLDARRSRCPINGEKWVPDSNDFDDKKPLRRFMRKPVVAT